MEERVLKSTIKVCQTNELSESEQHLVSLAIKATENAYSPYSHFSVGSAVLLENGKEITGCNQENAAFPVTICAERSALFAAGAQYPSTPVMAIAIAARNADGLLAEPVTPCGSCRQALVETEFRHKRKIRILLYGTSHVYMIDGINTLMPLSFTDDQM